MARPRADMQEITLARLRQNPPKVYQLAPNDVLGVYIENVLGQPDVPPPVNFPLDSSKPPSLGFPIPIREDGTVALPLVEPIQLTGLTLTQATDEIRKAYTVKQKILPEGKDRIIVTLQRPREYRVLVVREESGGSQSSGGQGRQGGGGQQVSSKRGAGYAVNLPAYENDLLHALTETGGLPGTDAENDILIFRGGFTDAVERDQLIARIKSGKDPCLCEPPLPDEKNVVRIPLRFFSDQVPKFKQDDIILNNGDIVMISSRDREKYYTGGAITGGEFLLPRDYDVNILQAIAIAGGRIGSGGTGIGQAGGNSGGGGFGGGSGGGGGIAPSRAIILRKTCNGGQIPIRVDLRKALSDPSQQILIQPEDTIIVQYTFVEEAYNALLRLVQFNFLFNGLSGSGSGSGR